MPFEADGGVPPTGSSDDRDPYRSQISLTKGVELSGKAAQEIVEQGNIFRAKYPWIFRYQDLIGFSIFCVSIAGIVLSSWSYINNFIPPVATIVCNAFWMSILHELEHDLIHYMYFRNNWLMHNLMMLGVCVMRPNSSSGWVRRRMHLHHHRVSGTVSDLEERAITNGYPWGLRRLLMTCDHVLSWALRMKEMESIQRAFLKAQPDLKTREQRRIVGILNMLALFPIGNIFYATWHAYLLLKPITAIFEPAWASTPFWQGYNEWMNLLLVVVYIPSVIRVACLQFVSSNMHYFGDVEPGNVIQQCQVWTSWFIQPLHLFCFNFGGTHAIHHFVARETFYVRQLTAYQMYPILKKYGVRFDDFASLLHANRRNASSVKNV